MDVLPSLLLVISPHLSFVFLWAPAALVLLVFGSLNQEISIFLTGFGSLGGSITLLLSLLFSLILLTLY